MKEPATFQPIYPAHAIERCAATLIFDQPLPQKLFDKTLLLAKAHLDAARFASAPAPAEIRVDAATGSISVNQSGSASVFNSLDGGTSLAIFPAMIIWQTTRYVRWMPFRGDFDRLTRPFLTTFLEVLSLAAIKLEYVDRFLWSGSIHDIDPWLLLRKDSGLVAAAAAKLGTSWHSHCGWFEQATRRRLINANVDVADVIRPPLDPQPSIGIFTLMQDHSDNHPFTSAEDILSGLDIIHHDLKVLLGKLIVESMCDRISLNPGA